MSPLLTLEDAADALRLSRRTVERLVAAGRLRVVHPSPGRTCITRRELEAYIASLEGRRAA
jgi:excisionase family DNA binding protein